MKKILLWLLVGVLCIGLGYGIARLLQDFRGISHEYQFVVRVLVAGDFSCELTPEELTLRRGETGTIRITNTASGGFDARIEYAVSGLPAGSYSFSENPVNPGQATTLTISSAGLASNTTYVCTLTARDYMP